VASDVPVRYNLATPVKIDASAMDVHVTSPEFHYESTPSPQWQQEQDPADSLYRVAYDAMNRGEWRRAADLFAQVTAKYPRSRRVMSATYYEAFMHYRIGTTEELRAAMRVLNDRSKLTPTSGNSSATQQELASLTTRIRGALAARGDAEAARQLSSDAQKGGCDSEDVQVKSEALSALAQADMTAAIPMLKRVLERRDPCLLELRRRSLSILLRRGDTAATTAAISVARATDEALELRTDAVSFLARLPGDNAIATLEELLRNSTEREVQRAAIRALSNTENTRARQTLRTLIERNDVSEQLRIEAVNTMERDPGNGRGDDAAYLRGLYPKLQAERVKIAAIAAISKSPGAENEQFVLRVARDAGESSEVRASAISRMYRLPGIAIAEIGKLYDTAESRSLREQIISVLSQRKEPETVDKLMDIVKTGTEPRLRGQATNALVKKDDPRAKKFLADLVGAP
jgi:HEAT repeat protein